MDKLNLISEKVLKKTPVFDLVERTVEGTDFKPVAIKCKDWVMICVTDDKVDRAVFVRQTRWGVLDKTVEFPCGTVEESDTATDAATKFQVAAARELEEETGIKIKPEQLHLIAEFNPNPAYFENKMHIFQVLVPDLDFVWENRGMQNLDSDEDCEVFMDHIYSHFKELSKNAMSICAVANL